MVPSDPSPLSSSGSLPSLPSLPYRTVFGGGEVAGMDEVDTENFARLVENRYSEKVNGAWALGVARSGPEHWVWMLARSALHIEGDRTLVEREMLLRALADAEREGVFWSRLLDRLCASSRVSAESRVSPWGRAVRGLEAKGVQPLPPTPEEQAMKLLPWISSQKDPAAFEPLFRIFQAPVLFAVIARNARVLSPEQIEKLRTVVPAEMSENPHLNNAARDHLVRAAFNDAIAEAEGGAEYRPTGRGSAIERLKTMVQAKEGFSLELQMEMLERARASKSSQINWYFYPLLADSPHLEEPALEVLYKSHSSSYIKILKHPNLGSDLREQMLREIPLLNIAAALAPEFSEWVRPEHLKIWADKLASHGPGYTHCRVALLNDSRSTPEMWERVLLPWQSRDTELVMAAANHPEAQHLPEIRPLIMKSRSVSVLSILLRGRPSADEFSKLFKALYRLDPEEAGDVLKSGPVPQGSRIPQEILISLLQSKDSQVRIAAVSAFGAGARTETQAEAPSRGKKRG